MCSKCRPIKCSYCSKDVFLVLETCTRQLVRFQFPVTLSSYCRCVAVRSCNYHLQNYCVGCCLKVSGGGSGGGGGGGMDAGIVVL